MKTLMTDVLQYLSISKKNSSTRIQKIYGICELITWHVSI